MTRAEMQAELLEVLNDSTSLGAWTTATLLGYLAEGQDEFCEGTGYFTDLSNLTITLATDTAVYDIPDRVIEIFNIWDGTRVLGKVASGNIASYDNGDVDLGTAIIDAPVWWQTDQETGVIKLTPTPTSDENGNTLVIQAWRYSLYDLADDGKEPEIPSRFRRACIEWAAYKAFMHHDMETQDPVKAADHLAAFKEYVRKGKRSLRRYQGQEVRVGADPAYRT